MRAGFPMKACLLNRAEYKSWLTANLITDSTFNPYVFSERVPDNKIWILLALSAFMQSSASSQSLGAFAVPPPISDQALNPQMPAIETDFSTQSGARNCAPIVRGGVQLSKGWNKLTTLEEFISTGEHNSVNLLAPPFVLQTTWALVVLQNPNGGGGSGFSITFSAMLIALDVCESDAELPPDASPAPRRFRQIYGTAG